ncbi:MAG TPA: right-handed parallel beta-helix repeat-containing protein [bacterium]|jgi:hypothetical protein
MNMHDRSPVTVSGDISGVWNLAGSPYVITGNVTVPTGQTLTIQPGVRVLFGGHYTFVVNGTLNAVGTEHDSIVFSREYPTEESKWGGIRMYSAAPNTHLAYCVIEYGKAIGGDFENIGGGLMTHLCSPTVEHCTFRNNEAIWAGGAISCDTGTPVFSRCVITNNTAPYGGGVNLWHSSATLLNCTVSGNMGSIDGGELRIGQSEAIIRNSIFSFSAGTGVTFAMGAPYGTFDHCNFFGNSLDNLSGEVPAGMGVMDHVNVHGDPCDASFNISLDPLFFNAGSANFRLTSGSPCIDGGNPSSPADPNGSVADIGAFSAGTVVCGNVSGVWTLANSPYYVSCQVTVSSGQTLRIEPGVQVKFLGHYKFEVEGTLRAIGTAQDSILFTRAFPTEASKWYGIRFWYASNTCSLAYCNVEYAKVDGPAGTYDAAGGGVFCLACSPTVVHSTLRYNWSRDGGGGFHCDAGSPHVSDCYVHDNVTAYYGGGMSAWHANPYVERTLIVRNTGVVGGGFSWGQGMPTLIHCTLSDNTASQMGAGVYCYDTDNSNFTMTSCIVANSHGSGIAFWEPNNVCHIRNCDVYGSTGENFQNPTWGPPGIGVLNHTNVNGDPCDVYNNIVLNPEFVNSANGDYHLNGTSPCIDSGDPALPHDTDGSVCDMGVFPYLHGTESGRGYVNVILSGPPNWGYRLTRQSGALSRLVFTRFCPGTQGSVGGAAAEHWTVLPNGDGNDGDSIIFVSDVPFTGAMLDTFRLSHPWCTDAVRWCSGDSCGSVEGPLPVELLSFAADGGNGYVRLKWATASESNSDHFEILRDGIALSRITAAGNSSARHDYAYVDRAVTNGATYRYTLVEVDINGSRSELTSASATPVSNVVLIDEYALQQNYPNPFNPTTSIVFDLLESGTVNLKVYNLMGQQVADLANGTMAQGRHQITFDAANLPSGVYLYRLKANEFVAEKKMLLMK